MTDEANIISNLITVSPVVGVLIYFIMYFQKALKLKREELVAKDATIQMKDDKIQLLNDQLKEGAVEIMSLGKDINGTLEKLIITLSK